MQNIFPLRGVVQHYAWGGHHYIPQLLGQDNTQSAPFAELWLGTHAKGTAQIQVEQQWQALDDFIAADPVQYLGVACAQQFDNKLPFLFKILDVRKMLSIQSHPTKAVAEQGFIEEEKLGIPRSAPNRTYRDSNHKPEIMVALTDFWLLHGFRSPEEIQQNLEQIPGWQELLPVFQVGGTQTLYQHVMQLPQSEVDRILQPLYQQLTSQRASLTDKNQSDFWALRAFEDYSQNGHYDRGLFSVYWLNLVYVPKGKAVFQAAGIPHAYLEGVNVELMANSDNVFRGGLTPKHIDLKALLPNLIYDGINPQYVQETKIGQLTLFPSPVDDFLLSSIQLRPQESYLHQKGAGPAIYLVLNGQLSFEQEQISMDTGKSFFVPNNAELTMTASVDSIIYRASTVRHN